jgi:hypothetical protein
LKDAQRRKGQQKVAETPNRDLPVACFLTNEAALL